MPRGWALNILKGLQGKEGWQFLVKSLAFAVTVYGVMVTVLAFKTQARNSEADAAERQFYRLFDDLASPDERVRIGAIGRAPAVMNRQVPLPNNPASLLEAVVASVRFQMPSEPIYNRDVKRLIHDYIKRDNPVTIEELNDRRKVESPAPPNPTDKSLSIRESRAVIEMLWVLGAEGWYDGRMRRPIPDRKQGLAWIWVDRPLIAGSRDYLDDAATAATLFEGACFESLDLSGFVLSNANFRSSRMPNAQFPYIKAEAASFQYSILDESNFTGAQLAGSQFNRSSLVNTDFGNGNLKQAVLELADLRGGKFRSSILIGANFTKVDARRATFEKANLDGADLSFSKLEEVDFTEVSARGTVFQYASLRGAELAGGDFSNADFSRVRNLDEIKGCYDANFAGVRGLSEEDLQRLAEGGAVWISDPKRWKSYKDNGRPHLRWRQFQDVQTSQSP